MDRFRCGWEPVLGLVVGSGSTMGGGSVKGEKVTPSKHGTVVKCYDGCGLG